MILGSNVVEVSEDKVVNWTREYGVERGWVITFIMRRSDVRLLF